MIREEEALSVCDDTRAELVKLIDKHAQIVKPKPWWRFGH